MSYDTTTEHLVKALESLYFIVNLLCQMTAGSDRWPISVRLPHVRQLFITRPVGGYENHLRIGGISGAVRVAEHWREHAARRTPRRTREHVI